MSADAASLINILDKYQKIVPTKPLGVALTAMGENRFGTELRERFANDGNFVIVTLEAALDMAEATEMQALALVSGNPADATKAYGKLGLLKRAGVPVVFAQPERKFPEAPSTWQTSGITHGGMFYLAGQYSRTIRPIGAYCEFGVYDGRTMAMAAHSLKNACSKFIAFDSFVGIGGTTFEESTHFKDGEYSANEETLRYNFRYAGLDDVNLEVVKGFFQDTLAGRSCMDDGIGPISVVHIDVDVYEPALLALRYVRAGLSDGALLIFDDYDQLAASNQKGERRALREWLQESPSVEVEMYRTYGAFGRSFIVHRRV